MEKKVGNHTLFNILGWAGIGLGITVVICLFNDSALYSLGFNTRKDYAELVISIAATSFSLSGLFFVLDNLYLQRETIKQQQISIEQQKEAIDLQKAELQNQILEMKESNAYFKQQNETLKIQQSESTFFNLLKNHKELIQNLEIGKEFGSEGLDKAIQYINTSLGAYIFGLKHKLFDNINTTYNTPENLYNNVKNLDAISNSITHNIELIIKKLDNNVFYHKILYHSLSRNEKYLIGLVLENNLCEVDKPTFNYSEFFRKETFYINKETSGFFPALTISLPEHIEFNYEKLAKDDVVFKQLINEKTKIEFDEKKHDVKLIEINYNYYYTPKKETNQVQFNKKHIVSENKLDLYFLFNEVFIDIYNNEFSDLNDFSMWFELFFLFEYNQNQYAVRFKKFRIGAHKIFHLVVDKVQGAESKRELVISIN